MDSGVVLANLDRLITEAAPSDRPVPTSPRGGGVGLVPAPGRDGATEDEVQATHDLARGGEGPEGVEVDGAECRAGDGFVKDADFLRELPVITTGHGFPPVHQDAPGPGFGLAVWPEASP
jgi:hypothetical protein